MSSKWEKNNFKEIILLLVKLCAKQFCEISCSNNLGIQLKDYVMQNIFEKTFGNSAVNVVKFGLFS